MHSPCWPVSGLTELLSSPSQVLVQGHSVAIDESKCCIQGFLMHAFVRFTVAGAAQVRSFRACGLKFSNKRR